MSRYYGMSVGIADHNPERVDAIKQAADEEWDFGDSWYDAPDSKLFADSNGYLISGESDEEFAERLTRAIWTANGGYCRVNVCATYLESLPYEEYVLEEEDYQQLVKRPAGASSPQEDQHHV